MLRISVFTVSMLTLVACASGNAQSDAAQLAWSRDTLVAELELIRDSADSVSPGDELQRPLNVRVIGSEHFVADVGANTIVVLDSNAHAVRRIGVRGSGPGELYGVSHLAVRNDRVFVGEALNGRVSEFTTRGRFVRAYASPFAAGALAANKTDVWSVARSASHYAARLTDDAEPVAAFERIVRPAVRPAVRGSRWTALPGYDLIASDSVSTWVLDQATTTLCRFNATDARPQCRAFPRSLVKRLNEYRTNRVAQLEKAMPVQVYAAPVAKDMVRAGAWIAVLLPLPELPIVLVDIDDGTLTPVVYPARELPAWARSARSFDWDGRGFFVVGDDGIGRILLSRRPLGREE